MPITILLDEEYGYKLYILKAQCTVEELQSAWDKQKSKGCFYFDSLGFFRKHKIKFSARPVHFGEHPLYGTGMFVLKKGFEDNDEVGDVQGSPACWESVKGMKIDCSIHLHDDDDSGILFSERTL